MIEASNFERIDQVSSFLGAIFDVFCGNVNKASVTEVFILYSDLNIIMKSELAQPFWTGEELSKIAKLVPEFEAGRTKLFGKYQASGMGTNNWYMSDHIVSASKDAGGLEVFHAGRFESDHRNYKQFYK